MKRYIALTLILAIATLLCPLSVYTVSGFSFDKETGEENEAQKNDDTISVYMADTGEVTSLPFRDYIIGVVAAEMPAVFHSEALSALGAAAATLARKKLLEEKDESLSGAVISTDPGVHQAYMSKEKMKETYKEDFEEYYKKIADAVDKSIDYSITYNDELITAAYHAISTGLTESAENVWSASLPYLVEVKSEGDSLSPGFTSQKDVSFSQFREILSPKGSVFSSEPSQWISQPLYTRAGTLKSVNIGNKAYTGDELRELFSLRSSAIELTVNDDGIRFSVKGYGHGVGLSQYGADYYARQGMTWEEIIKHYYKGVSITRLSAAG